MGCVRSEEKSEMHELFTKILAKRDLSRAGDLFSVADNEIVADLTDVVSGRAF